MELSVRSGGHDYVCSSLRNDSINFDMREINDVELIKEWDLPKKVRSTQIVRKRFSSAIFEDDQPHNNSLEKCL